MAAPGSSQRHGLRLAVVALALGGAVLLSAGPAAAHDPLILGPDNASPTAGPLLPDGTISFAIYGVIDAPGDARGFRVRFAEGDALRLTVLIPDLAPENVLDPQQLPRLELVRPNGTTATVGATVREPFAEPFSGTNYITYLRVDEPAQAGDYAFTVTGDVPARFTVAVGDKEQFGTPVEGVDDRAGGLTGVQAWYSTPPPVAAADVTPDGSAEEPAASVAAPAAPSGSTAEDASASSPWPLIGAVVVVAGAVAVGLVVLARRRGRT